MGRAGPRERGWLESMSFLKEWQWPEAMGSRVTSEERPLGLGVLPVQWASSQADNYLVWAKLAWVTTVTKHLTDSKPCPIPIPGRRPEKWEILLLSRPGLPERPIPKGQSVPRGWDGSKSEARVGARQIGWPLGARAAMGARPSLRPSGTPWPHHSHNHLPGPAQGASPQVHEVHTKGHFIDYLLERERWPPLCIHSDTSG